MSFLEPLFLLGLVAAALPVVVHLFNRRKAVRRHFPAMQLLLESNKKVARSIKVRQWLLMALRILALVLLVLALAKPYILSSKGLTAEQRMPTAVVFVVDTSFSMNHQGWWEQANKHFNEQLARLRPWDEVAIVTTTQSTPALGRLTSDHGEARRVFRQLELTQRVGDLSRALVAAGEIIATSQLPNQKIVAISDFSYGNFSTHSLPQQPLPYPVEMLSVRRGNESVTPNLAVTGLKYEQEGSRQERTWRIEAMVHNYGEADASGVEIQLTIGGRLITAGKLDVPAGESIAHVFRHRIEGSGIQRATVSLSDADKLDVDNTWHASIYLREHVRVLVVNGKPNSVPQHDEVFFLWHALNTSQHSDAPIVPTVTTIDGVEARDLENYDVVFLANVPKLSQAATMQLTRFIEKGGGLFISLGTQADAAFYNAQLSHLMPRPLRDMKQLAQRHDPDAPIKVTRLGHARRQHPIFRVFSLPGGSSIQSVQVYSYMLLEPTAGDDNTTVLLSYQDNAPALLERRVGQGKVLLLTTTIDREWTDLPIRTAYLPLMRRAMQYLARSSASSGSDVFRVGERVRIEVSDLVQERAIIRTPSNTRLVLEPIDGEVSFVPEETGFYEVWADSDESSEDTTQIPKNRLDQLAFAVNLDTRGSNLRVVPEQVLLPWQNTSESGAEQLPGLASAQDSPQRRVNIWPRILFVMTIILLLETVFGMRRSVLLKIAQSLRLRLHTS